MGCGDVARQEHALREQNFLAARTQHWTSIFRREQVVLNSLGMQREMLKKRSLDEPAAQMVVPHRTKIADRI